MLAAIAAVVITAFVVTTWLLTIASHAKPGTEQANSRLNAVRTGLAAGAGAGAAVGLMLAFRRQRHQEIATDLTVGDATERRITELYTKAVEQLGNDKAPVRLGGLYALERLAQDNPAHRQTIVSVICAYLRMPFSPTPPASKPEPEATEAPAEHAAEAETSPVALGDTWHQERQVRLTAQRVLAEHLRDDRAKEKRSTDPPSPRLWPDMRLDLAGATLIDFSLVNGVMADADFSRATFRGDAGFGGATFSSDASFIGATFSFADFSGATFSGNVRFSEATFSGPVAFIRATFSDDVEFATATFSDAAFNEATFNGTSWFGGATFNRVAVFIGATFSGNVRFSEATFSGTAWFRGATFSGAAAFNEATFSGAAAFNEATFSGTARFGGVTFSGAAVFIEATFSGGEDSLSFDRSGVTHPDAQHDWPTGWCLGPDGNGGYTVVREEDAGRS